MGLNKKIQESDSAHGSVQEWDAIWKTVDDVGVSLANLFTRATPKTICQFWQRCYFEDLLSTIRPKSDWSFLDLASFRGTTSMYLASQGFKDITLLDLSDTANNEPPL